MSKADLTPERLAELGRLYASVSHFGWAGRDSDALNAIFEVFPALLAMAARAAEVERERDDARAALAGFEWAAGVYDEGPLTVQQIGYELNDYQMIISEVSLVYDHVTRGRISKLNTCAHEVIAAYDDICTEDVEEAVKEAVEGAVDSAEAQRDAAQAEAKTLREAINKALRDLNNPNGCAPNYIARDLRVALSSAADKGGEG